MVKKYQPVKLEDLAKRLNVSSVTVSKALRDHPDISPETKQKIKALAEEMNYMPNIMARSLSSRKSYTIGVVVPKIAHIFFSTVIEAIYNAAFRHQYEIVLTVSQEMAEREKKHLQSLISMRVDGLIVSITQETKDVTFFEQINKMGLPLVFIDRVPIMKNVSSVTVDDFGGAFMATEYAIKRGYKKIAHIGGFQHLNIGKARLEGFTAAMKKHNIPINKNWITEGGFGEEDGYTSFMRIYNSRNLPEYILAVTYPVALGVFTAANELGLSIPNDFEVTCFGKNTYQRHLPSVFNFVDQPAAELGSTAIELILQQINKTEGFEPKKITLSTQMMLHDATILKELAVK